jgi:hypothetical protein
VDQYQLHQLVTVITEGAERPEATTIRQQFVNIAGTVFNWRDTVTINVKKFATNAAKTQSYGIRVHDNLKAVVILANVEWAARQSWGTEIGVAHRTIKAKYRYDHTHDTASIKEILKVLTGADKARDRCKAPAPGEKAAMVSQGLEHLRQLIQQQPSLSSDSADTESAYATTDSKDGGQSRGRSKGRRKLDKKTTCKSTPSPSTSRSPSPPAKGRNRSRHRAKSSDSTSGDRNEKEVEQRSWILVKNKGSKLQHKPDQYYIELNNAHSNLAEFSADPSSDEAPPTAVSLFKLKATKRRHQRIQRKIKKKLKDSTETDDDIIEQYIDMAEDERTEMAKNDKSNARRVAIDTAHSTPTKQNPSLLQHSKNLGRMLSAARHRLVCKITHSNQNRVTFAGQAMVAEYNNEDSTVMVTYDSGADGHYINEKDRKTVSLPILRISAKKVGVANESTCKGQYVTVLPFPQLSTKAAEADTFDDFPTSLMSVGKTADDGNISIFTKEGVSVYKEEDVLITCKGEAILIGKRDECGRYRIPLVQNRGNWQPKQPTKRSKKYLQQANGLYDLPSTEEAIKWMHAVCGYPVKSTWLKAVRAGNYIGWPLLTERNVNKYYPETTETPKGHMNQTRKNVRSTKVKPTTWEQQTQSPLEEPNTSQLTGKKVRDVFTRVNDIRETVFSDQTGRFPRDSNEAINT